MYRSVLSLLCVFCLVSIDSAVAGIGSHYVNGIEGIQAASMPPPGFYWRSYNTYYTASEYRDNKGNKTSTDFQLRVFATSNRFMWSTDTNIIGGNLLIDAVIPVVYTNMYVHNAGSSSASDYNWGLGDPIADIILAWHGSWYDACVGQNIFFPLGRYDSDRMANAGKGFWTFMYSAGGTVYFDKEKTWSASVLARYQINTQQEKTRITAGDTFSFEWGVGKEIVKNLTVGASGYCSWQLNDDWGKNATKGRSIAYAVGPEVDFPVPVVNMLAQLRFLFEFENKNNPQGQVLNLTLTKRF